MPDPFPRLGELLLVEKGLFTKEEFLKIVKTVNQEMKRKAGDAWSEI